MGAISATGTKDRRKGRPWDRHHHGHPVIKAAHDERTLGERVADEIASFGGSWPFIFLFLGLIASWMVLNTVFLGKALHHRQFDPFPYIALNLMLSGLAGLQAPIIMMSQNRAAARDEALAAHHYDEGEKMQGLLQANTDLTREVHRLTLEIHALVRAPEGSGPPRG
ncbi:MAG: DUF1003 domain-containing protein [Acidobacteria bacterium]|nr:DUF1003 domain-containing protein [Acidobacteriota bacterium]